MPHRDARTQVADIPDSRKAGKAIKPFDLLTERNNAMNAFDITLKIKEILQERFGINTASMTDDTKLQDLGIDSLHLADVMLDLETELDIVITDLSLLPETTLGELAATVSQAIAKRA